MKSMCLSLLAAVTMLSVGCSATGDVPNATDGGGASTPTSVPPGTLGAQPTDLSGVPLNPNPKYRLVVAFSQFDDDFAPTPVDVALDVPFDITATTIDLSALRAPAANTIFCPRKDKRRGEVPGPCDAGAAYHVAIGYLMIVEDANRNGKADFGNSGGDGRATLLAPDSRVGIAVGAVLYDETSGSILPRGNGGKPILLDSPVPKGFSIYEAYRPEGGAIFDRLRPPTSAIRFSVKGPNLT